MDRITGKLIETRERIIEHTTGNRFTQAVSVSSSIITVIAQSVPLGLHVGIGQFLLQSSNVLLAQKKPG